MAAMLHDISTVISQRRRLLETNIPMHYCQSVKHNATYSQMNVSIPERLCNWNSIYNNLNNLTQLNA